MSLSNCTPLSAEVLEATAQLCADNPAAGAEGRFRRATNGYDETVTYYLRTLARKIRQVQATLPEAPRVRVDGHNRYSTKFDLPDVAGGTGMWVTVVDGDVLRVGFGISGPPPSVVIQAGDPAWPLTAELRAALVPHLVVPVPAG